MSQTLGNGLNNINDAADYAAVKADRHTSRLAQPGREIQYGAAGAGGTTDVDAVLGYKYAKGEGQQSTAAKTVMENFEEYIKTKQERAREAGEDEETREREERENAKELARNLSSEELQQLAMMGIDVTSVRLSDIAGIVNTMRGNAHREQTAQMLAEISMANGDMDGLTVIGGSVRAAGTKVELDNVSVLDVSGAEEDVEETVPQPEREPEKNAESIQLGNDELLYLLKNNLSFTRENMYKAHYSGSHAANAGSADALFEDMRAQIEKVISQAGYETDETSLADAKLLIENDLPVTTDTIRTVHDWRENLGKLQEYMEHGQYDRESIAEVAANADAEAVNRDRAEALYRAVNSITPDTVYQMTMQGREVTIASAYAEMSRLPEDRQALSPQTEDESQDIETELRAVANMRRMEEIRLSMTLEVSVRLVKSDFNIDTRELSRVVLELQNMEKELMERQMRRAGVDLSEQNVSLYHDMTEKMRGLALAPADVLARPLSGSAFTVNALYEASFSEETTVSGGTVRASYETVRRSYEAVQTAPRADMGDSITKAFSNVDDILRELDMPVNYETQRAVRILGYNSLEITTENVSQIVEYDRQVNDLMDSFYPEAVLSVIKDGINPMDVPIDELNQIIRDRNYNEGVTEAENFATYLLDMERQGEVTPEERESYIGIYRFMNRLAKSGDREAGYLFAKGSRLTVRNLITAMRSRRAAGMDVSVDDDFGMLTSADVRGKRMDTQIESAFAANERYLKDMTEETEQFMLENEIEMTMVNGSAVSAMLDEGGLYSLVSEVLSRLHFGTDDARENLIDAETGNMADSLLGEDVPIQIPDEFAAERILESLKGSGEMSLAYEGLRDRLTELMYQAGASGNLTGMDISAVKTVQAGFNILSHMAKRDRYQLPVQTEQGMKIVNLTIRHSADGEKSGTIELYIRGQQMGTVSAEIQVDGENRLSGYVVSENSEGNYLLMEQGQQIEDELQALGYEAHEVLVGQMSEENSAGTIAARTPAAAETVYQASVSLVRIIAKVIR